MVAGVHPAGRAGRWGWVPVEADRGGVVAEFALAGLVDRAGEVPDELGGLEIGLFGKHGSHSAIAELPLAEPTSPRGIRVGPAVR